MGTTIHILFHCNEWKEYSSYRLIGVVDEEHLIDAINDIKKECGYSDEDIDTYIAIETRDLNDLDI